MKHFGKYFAVMSALLTAYLLWVAGYDTGRHHYAQMGYDFILAAFWGITLLFVSLGERQNKKLDQELSDLHAKLMSEIEQVAKQAAEPSDDEKKAEWLGDVLMAVTKDLHPNGPPKKDSELRAIEVAFHENTDHYARLTFKPGGIAAEINDEPFPTPTPKTTKIPVKKVATRAKRVPVKRMVDPEQLKREQRNAARRAQRAAKKGK